MLELIGYFLLYLAAAFIGVYLARATFNHIEYPYRWSCPDCQFSVKTNSKYAFARVKEAHDTSCRELT